MADLSFISILSIGIMVAVFCVALYQLSRMRTSRAKRAETPSGIADPFAQASSAPI